MTDTQPTLFDTCRRTPTVTDGDVDSLVAALKPMVWCKAKILCRSLDWDDRTLRAVAAASDGLVVSGQSGYALLANVTPDEAQHAANWLEHQANEMGRRARAIRRQMHQIFPNQTQHQPKEEAA